MGGESPEPVSISTGAVFLSYASQDADAAWRICDALRASGIEVWFDQSELRGGDAWDRKIRDQIRNCRLFIPVISANTERRDEGYFRREWALAEDRTRDMAHKRTFLVPVVVDDTSGRGASVPEKFSELQWTRLTNGETPPAFVERIRHLLTPDSPVTTVSAGPTSGTLMATSVRPPSISKAAMWGVVGIVVLVCAYFVADKLWLSKHSAPPTQPAAPTSQQSAPPAGTAVAFNPPPHSLAVLPFVNMSGDAAQEYFSDGLTEEVLNSLARINELQVSARTSSFSFKGKDADIGTIAHKLNVASVLEGSVRRSGHTIRVTAQLNDATTGYHLWSQTYDRDLGDVLKLQTDIANAVANALKVTLLHDVAAKIELGGTRNPAAFDAYLRASGAYRRFGPVNLAAGGLNEAGLQAAIAAYNEAIRADPDYALAYAGRSLAFADFARALVTGPGVADYLNKAQRDARKAIALARDLADGHLALANFYTGSLEFTDAFKEYEHALELAPGNARVLGEYGAFAVLIGRTESGLAAARRLLVLDPLNSMNHFGLGVSLMFSRRYGEAIRALSDAKAQMPEDVAVNMWLGIAYYFSGDFQSARAACEKAGDFNGPWCLAMVYNKLGQHTEAEAMLAKVRASASDRLAEGYADIYAQWGDTARALDWLDIAMRTRDPYLAYTKLNPFFDPLRREPRFQAIERALKFPD
jgi:TolB-like protein